METVSLSLKPGARSSLPIRAIQFGEGNFIRGFIDWMICRCNKQGLFNGRVLALQCTPHGQVLPKLKAQDGLFTVIFHSTKDGVDTFETELVNTIKDIMNPYEDWEAVLAACMSRDIKVVFSNTTETGLVFKSEQPFNTDVCPETFPGKLTAILYERFKRFDGASGTGLVMIPCELMQDNGNKLRDLVMQHIVDQSLSDDFKNYVLTECRFVNTLVDRVVAGYPDNPDFYYQMLRYKDELLVNGERFHFFAMEGDESLERLLPFAKAGLNVVVAKDITPYRLRKLRILYGTHTANVPAAYMFGLETVDQMMDHPVIGKFVRSMILDEIVPAINLDKTMLLEFANDVIYRFSDPSMHHKLASILMNTTAKVKNCILPTVLDSRAKGILPKRMCFALAAYICLYKDNDGTVPVKVKHGKEGHGQFMDDAYATEVMHKAWALYNKTEASALSTVNLVLSDVKLWDCNLASDIDLTALVARLVHAICSDGIEDTVLDLLEHN